MIVYLTDRHQFELTGGTDKLQASLSGSVLEEGLYCIELKLTAPDAVQPAPLKLSWIHPVCDVAGFWHPGAGRIKGLHVDWGEGFTSKATTWAPVGSFFSASGRNRLTFAFSDALNTVGVKAGVHEESACFHCSVTLFQEPSPPIAGYSAKLLVDTRDLDYSEALLGVQEWWQEQPGFEPAPVPDAARQPMYSTWYSMHQEVDPEEIEKQCRLARELGCDAVIVDDGWQTSDHARGYAYCGDWEVYTGKIPDMAAHVKRVQALGMKYLLWYSVPFIGYRSKTWETFHDKLLYRLDHIGAGVADPRFPEVREYLIGIYENAVNDWGLDGLKLDFVDNFYLAADKEQAGAVPAGCDIASVPDAADRLLTDIIARLRGLKPDIMIEFRQSYIGPLMRKYGNMFRAADCPNDAIENRVRTLDIRLLSGGTAVHADMLMWHPDEPVESAALQIINILFSVPQLSLRLDRLPEQHVRMVRYWMSFWKEHRDVLLDGRLSPRHPELLYPVVEASSAGKRLIAVYQDTVVRLEKEPSCIGERKGMPQEWIIVNGTPRERLVLETPDDCGPFRLLIRNCTGDSVLEDTLTLQAGLHALPIPPSGTAVLQSIADASGV